jgi:DNA-damage-inducible protein J
MPQFLPLDPELAAKAESLFRELGLDLSTAVHLFLRQSLRENGLPFTPRLAAPAPAAEPAAPEVQPAQPRAEEQPVFESPAPAPEPFSKAESRAQESPELPHLDAETDDVLEGETFGGADEATAFAPAPAAEAFPAPESAPPLSAPDHEEAQLSDPRQVFHDMKLIGMPLRRIRSLNQLYAIGEANPHVQGWREVYVSGDEPFALDFGSVRVELGWQGGGSIRMMDGRLPDEVLESDAVFPRELSPVFSSVIGQRLVDVSSTRVRRGQNESEQLRLRFSNGSTLTFSPGESWGALWLSDAHGSVMFAPDAVWRHVLGERSWQNLR